MTNTLPKRFVVVAMPSVHAGIGDALRKAFHAPELFSNRVFERLLARLRRD